MDCPSSRILFVGPALAEWSGRFPAACVIVQIGSERKPVGHTVFSDGARIAPTFTPRYHGGLLMRVYHSMAWRVAALGLALALSSFRAGGQELSVNVQLLSAARAGDQLGVTQALKQGAMVNARNRLGETVLLIALKNDRPAM